MDIEDRKWIMAGSGCVAAGLIVALITKSWSWFAVGATTGATVVGGRFYYKYTDSKKEEEVVVENASERGQVAEKSASSTGMPIPTPRQTAYPTDMLGAPLIDSMDTSPANKPRMLSRSEVAGYPMRHRIPECDMFALPMDPRGYSGLVDEIRRVW